GGAQADDLAPVEVEAVEVPAGARLDVGRALAARVEGAGAAQGAEVGAVQVNLGPAVAGVGGRHGPVPVGGRAEGRGGHLGADLVLAVAAQAQHEAVDPAAVLAPVGQVRAAVPADGQVGGGGVEERTLMGDDPLQLDGGAGGGGGEDEQQGDEGAGDARHGSL